MTKSTWKGLHIGLCCIYCCIAVDRSINSSHNTCILAEWSHHSKSFIYKIVKVSVALIKNSSPNDYAQWINQYVEFSSAFSSAMTPITVDYHIYHMTKRICCDRTKWSVYQKSHSNMFLSLHERGSVVHELSVLLFRLYCPDTISIVLPIHKYILIFIVMRKCKKVGNHCSKLRIHLFLLSNAFLLDTNGPKSNPTKISKCTLWRSSELKAVDGYIFQHTSPISNRTNLMIDGRGVFQSNKGRVW